MAGQDTFSRLQLPVTARGDRVRTVHTISEDPDGMLWLGTDKGIWLLDPQTLKVRRPATASPKADSMRDSKAPATSGVTSMPAAVISARDLRKEFGDFLKQKCKGSDAFIYVGDPELVKEVGLKAAWKKPLRNGGLDGRLVKYELY